MLDRRFIRIKALQALYAFYVNQRAHLRVGEMKIRSAFAACRISSEQEPVPENDQVEVALLAFKTAVSKGEAVAGTGAEIDTARAALSQYHALEKASRKALVMGLDEAREQITFNYLKLLQLCVEWQRLATTSEGQPAEQGLVACLRGNKLLQALAENQTLAERVQAASAGWEQERALVHRWWKQCLEQPPKWLETALVPATDKAAQQSIIHLIHRVFFAEPALEELFTGLDLHWATHQPVVAKMLLRTSTVLRKCLRQEATWTGEEVWDHWREERDFYVQLVEKTVENDAAYEGEIVAKMANWQVERMVGLDRVILKLALCEQRNFNNIPVSVSINEYLEIAKCYSTPKSGQFINGILEALVLNK